MQVCEICLTSVKIVICRKCPQVKIVLCSQTHVNLLCAVQHGNLTLRSLNSVEPYAFTLWKMTTLTRLPSLSYKRDLYFSFAFNYTCLLWNLRRIIFSTCQNCDRFVMVIHFVV